MSNKLMVTVDGVKYSAISAKLWVSDGPANSYSSDYNHPELSVIMAPSGADPQDTWKNIGVTLAYQRSVYRGADDRAYGYMDTATAWTRSYAGHVVLDNAGRFQLVDRPYTLEADDKVRVAVGRRIAKVIAAGNLWSVEPCEVHRAVRALGVLGVTVDKIYHRTQGGTCELRECPGRGAASRADSQVA